MKGSKDGLQEDVKGGCLTVVANNFDKKTLGFEGQTTRR
jgi:hypothetical protein